MSQIWMQAKPLQNHRQYVMQVRILAKQFDRGMHMLALHDEFETEFHD